MFTKPGQLLSRLETRGDPLCLEVAQLTSQLASAHLWGSQTIPLNGDGQYCAGEVHQGCQGGHSCKVDHLQKEGKGSLEPKNELSQLIVIHTVIYLIAWRTSKWTWRLERKRFKAGLKPNIALILSIFFFHPSGTRSGANLYLADRLCCSIAFIPGVCRLWFTN